MTVTKSVGTSTSDLVGTVASVVTYTVRAPSIAGVLMVRHGGRSPGVLLCFVMSHEFLRSYYSDFSPAQGGLGILCGMLWEARVNSRNKQKKISFIAIQRLV